MRISELADRTGVAISTLKYYQREKLLPDGEHRNATQVDYDDRHVRRVRLIRALMVTGNLSLVATRRVLRELDDDAPLQEVFGAAQHALAGDYPVACERARARVIELARERGWKISKDNPGVDVAARAIAELTSYDAPPTMPYLEAYATAASLAANADFGALSRNAEREEIAELMVLGTVLSDAIFAGLRRLAQQDLSGALATDFG